MTNTQIKEFKKYVKNVLVKKYAMNELDAHRSVQKSYLSTALKMDPCYVEHDTVEEWAEFVYREINDIELMRM